MCQGKAQFGPRTNSLPLRKTEVFSLFYSAQPSLSLGEARLVPGTKRGERRQKKFMCYKFVCLIHPLVEALGLAFQAFRDLERALIEALNTSESDLFKGIEKGGVKEAMQYLQGV